MSQAICRHYPLTLPPPPGADRRDPIPGETREHPDPKPGPPRPRDRPRGLGAGRPALRRRDRGGPATCADLIQDVDFRVILVSAPAEFSGRPRDGAIYCQVVRMPDIPMTRVGQIKVATLVAAAESLSRRATGSSA